MKSEDKYSCLSLQRKDRKSLHIISLGCPRNTVDSQYIVSSYLSKGYVYSQDIDLADVIILNTCAFIGDAIRESIEVMNGLEEYVKKGKKVIIMGCLLERYPKEIKEAFPFFEFMGCVDVRKLPGRYPVLFSEGAYAYLKICEGCLSRCSYCAIPLIRGKLSSRSIRGIVDEAKKIEDMGKKELVIVGQDTTAYGFDRYGEFEIEKLLSEVLKHTRIDWIRIMYAHPAFIRDSLIEMISNEDRIVNYIDLPIQHANTDVLKKMNRGYDRERLERIMTKLGNYGIAVRTTVMVGFPSETEKRFEELLLFLKQYDFARLGAFIYSREEGTSAYRMRQIPGRVSKKRFDKVMRLAKSLSLRRNKKMLGKNVNIIIDGALFEEKDVYIGRTYMDCPEIDGLAYVSSKRLLNTGDIVSATVLNVNSYDLFCEIPGT